jgi:hypothetical protein
MARIGCIVLRLAPLLSRRRFVSLAAAVIADVASAPKLIAARSANILNPVPYFAEGETGEDSINNCGPATLASAIAYSGVASPTVQDVRAALGFSGPTSTDQWTQLLDHFHVPWRATWSRCDIDQAVRSGQAVIIAVWMDDLSVAADFEQAGSSKAGQVGRYNGFSFGHSMLIVGSVDHQKTYLVHDPNVFEADAVDWYGDGSPKGAFRRYDADEIWRTVQTYAGGFGIAVAPPQTLPEAAATSNKLKTSS